MRLPQPVVPCAAEKRCDVRDDPLGGFNIGIVPQSLVFLEESRSGGHPVLKYVPLQVHDHRVRLSPQYQSRRLYSREDGLGVARLEKVL